MKVKVGDKLPDAKVFLLEKDPKEVSIKKIINGEKTILFGLPGAFTPTCSGKHLPSFINASEEIKKRGIKKSSAQITHYYNEQNLVGKQVIGVCNFPKKNIAGIVSEILILGAIEKDGKVVLVHPSQKVENGLEIA